MAHRHKSKAKTETTGVDQNSRESYLRQAVSVVPEEIYGPMRGETVSCIADHLQKTVKAVSLVGFMPPDHVVKAEGLTQDDFLAEVRRRTSEMVVAAGQTPIFSPNGLAGKEVQQAEIRQADIMYLQEELKRLGIAEAERSQIVTRYNDCVNSLLSTTLRR